MATPDVILSRLVLCHTQILGSYLVSAQAGVLRDALTVHLHLYKFFKCRSMILFFSRNTVFCSDVRMSIKKNNVSQNIKHFKQSNEGKWEVGKRGKKEEFLFCFLFPDTHLYSKLARSLLKWILVVCICLPSFSISLSLAKTCHSINLLHIERLGLWSNLII